MSRRRPTHTWCLQPKMAYSAIGLEPRVWRDAALQRHPNAKQRAVLKLAPSTPCVRCRLSKNAELTAIAGEVPVKLLTKAVEAILKVTPARRQFSQRWRSLGSLCRLCSSRLRVRKGTRVDGPERP